MSPKLSVLMPVFNIESRRRGLEYLNAAIESVLMQDFEDFELIVIDDGSTDQTVAHLKSWASADDRVRVIAQPKNGGIGVALNAGALAARAPYLARMDADDMSVVYRFSEQLRVLATKDVGIVGSGMWVMNASDFVIMEIVRPSSHEDILRFAIAYGCPFVHGSVCMRKDVFERAGGYKPREICAAEDFDLWLRVLDLTKGYNVPEPLYYYRESATQLSRTNAERIAQDTSEVIAGFRSRFGRALTQ